MIYPQLKEEPNLLLIGIAAVFGLLLVIITFYIISTQNNNLKSNYDKTYNSRKNMNNDNKNNNINMINNNINNNNKNNNNIITPQNNKTSSPKPVNKELLSKSLSKLADFKQVFNIKENIYTLDDAAGVCGALGADVASINQLIDAHKLGADWCNVGWTSDGLAAYPIQYSTWKTLQDNEPNKRNICGDVGINLARNDPNLLYGVNCYGVKPEPKGDEKVKDAIISDKQSKLNAKIIQFRKNMNAIGVAPFNTDNWSS